MRAPILIIPFILGGWLAINGTLEQWQAANRRTSLRPRAKRWGARAGGLLAAVCVSLSACGADNQAFAADPGVRPVHLASESQINPLSIDRLQPALSWIVDAPGRRGVTQSAYRVLVASSAELLSSGRGDLWDSGKVSSRESSYQIYGGKALTSRQQCFWKVKIWDQQQQESPWSDPAEWTMGILEGTLWQAKWIGAPALAPEAEGVKFVKVENGLSIFTVQSGSYRFSVGK